MCIKAKLEIEIMVGAIFQCGICSKNTHRMDIRLIQKLAMLPLNSMSGYFRIYLYRPHVGCKMSMKARLKGSYFFKNNTREGRSAKGWLERRAIPPQPYPNKGYMQAFTCVPSNTGKQLYNIKQRSIVMRSSVHIELWPVIFLSLTALQDFTPFGLGLFLRPRATTEIKPLN